MPYKPGCRGYLRATTVAYHSEGDANLDATVFPAARERGIAGSTTILPAQRPRQDAGGTRDQIQVVFEASQGPAGTLPVGAIPGGLQGGGLPVSLAAFI